MSARRHAPADQGMTLVEILIAMLIMATIMGPIAAVTTIGYRSWTSATTTLAVSHDRQLLQTYFTRDVASATRAILNKTSSSCYTAGPSLVALKWNGGPSSTVLNSWANSYEADYSQTTIGGKPALIRTLCSFDKDGNSTGPNSVTTVAHSLSLTAPQPASAACNPAADGVTGKCPLVTRTTPVSVTLTVTDAAEISYSVRSQQRAQGENV
jgi:prepilin-type N-terminal cleavage/methylation domain-containing protein